MPGQEDKDLLDADSVDIEEFAERVRSYESEMDAIIEFEQQLAEMDKEINEACAEIINAFALNFDKHMMEEINNFRKALKDKETNEDTKTDS